MSFELSDADWARIEAFQSDEIRRFSMDHEFVRKMAKSPHYSSIGSWFDVVEDGRALEIGCGPGRYVAILHGLGYRVVGADPAVYAAWKHLAKDGIEFQSGVKAEELPYDAESFDAVACMGALLYFQDPALALGEIRRVLKPGGRLVVRTVNRTSLYRLLRGRNLDPATVCVYTESDLREALEGHGFEVARTSAYGFYPPWFEDRWWLAVNGRIPLSAQIAMSMLCPRSLRVNVNAYAVKK